MTNYSHILPSEILLERDPMDDSCAARSWDEAAIMISADTVYFSTRSYYGGDGVPMDEYHGLTMRFPIDSSKGGAILLDRDALADDLADGGKLSILIDRIKSGLDSKWDGSNSVGTLTDDAREASDDLAMWLEQESYVSDVAVWGAAEFISDLAMSEVKSTWSDDDCRNFAIKNCVSEPGILVVGDASDYVIYLRDQAREFEQVDAE